MSAQWYGPAWLQPLLSGFDDTIFHRVTSVRMEDRQVPDALLDFQHLENVQLRSCQLTQTQAEKLRQIVPDLTIQFSDIIPTQLNTTAACKAQSGENMLACATNLTESDVQ